MKEKEVEKINLMIYPVTVTGLGILMFLDLLSFSHLVKFVQNQAWTMLVIVGYFLYVPIYIWFNELTFSRFKLQMRHVKSRKETWIRVKLVLVSTLDWLLAALLFYLISVEFHAPVTFFEAMSIYSISTALGVVSMIPGGVGSFDLMAIIGLTYYGADHSTAITVLLLFRLFYYVVPLLVSGVLLLFEYRKEVGSVLRKMKSVTEFEEEVPFGETKEISDFIGNLMIWFLFAVTFLSGAVLIVSSATPGIVSRIRIMQNILSMPILQFSHRISLTLGILLILLSGDVIKKVHRSFLTILILLFLGIIFTFLKGMDLEEALYLLGSFILLLVAKPAFRRKNAPYSVMNGVMLLAGLGGTLLYMFAFENTRKPHWGAISMEQFLHFTPDDFMMNGILSFLFAVVFYILWRKSLPKAPLHPRPVH